MPPGVAAENQLCLQDLSKKANRQTTKPEEKSLCFTRAGATKN